MASWLVRSTPERVVRVRALAGDIVLCSWVRHFTLTVPLFTQVYKWVPANLMLGVTLRWTSIPSRDPILVPSHPILVASCYRNRDKLRPGGPHWPVCRLLLLLTLECSCVVPVGDLFKSYNTGHLNILLSSTSCLFLLPLTPPLLE